MVNAKIKGQSTHFGTKKWDGHLQTKKMFVFTLFIVQKASEIFGEWWSKTLRNRGR